MRHKHHFMSKLEEAIEQMTPLEKEIARFFIESDLKDDDLASAKIISRLHISNAALTRFAKKCGFSGYRAFSFEYSKSVQKNESNGQNFTLERTKRVLFDYDSLIDKTYDLVDEAKLQALAQKIDQSERIYFYGKGSSALVAQEMKLRFMRLGLICDAYSDTDGFTWANSLVNEKCLVIAFSLSGKTQSVISALEKASQKGASSILLTTHPKPAFPKEIEVIKVASTHKLNYGNRISPQFPLLIMMDIIYAYVLAIDKAKKEEIFKDTIIN